MGDEITSEGIGPVTKGAAIHQGNVEPDAQKQNRHGSERRRSRKELKQYLHTAQVAAEESNRILEKKALPYRIKLYEKDGEILFSILRTGTESNSGTELIKDITHEDFAKWIEDISKIEGLYLDTTA